LFGYGHPFTTKNKKKQLRSIENSYQDPTKYAGIAFCGGCAKFGHCRTYGRGKQNTGKGNLCPFIEQIESFSDDRFTTMELSGALLKIASNGRYLVKTSNNKNSIAIPIWLRYTLMSVRKATYIPVILSVPSPTGQSFPE